MNQGKELVEMITWIKRWRQRRARRVEVAEQLEKFAVEGRIIARAALADKDTVLVYEILEKCKFLDDLARQVRRGEVEPRSIEAVAQSEWPEVIEG